MEACSRVHVFQGKCTLPLDHAGAHVFERPERGSAANQASKVTGRDMVTGVDVCVDIESREREKANR